MNRILVLLILGISLTAFSITSINQVFAENIVTNQYFPQVAENPNWYTGIGTKLSGQIGNKQIFDELFGSVFKVGNIGGTKNEVWIQQGIRKEPLSVDDCYIIEGNIYDSNTLGNNFGTKFDVAWIELEKFTQVDCLEAISPTVAENNVPQTKQVESAIITLEKVQLSLRMF